MVYLLPFVVLAALYALVSRRDLRIGIVIAGGIALAILVVAAGRDLVFPSSPPRLDPAEVSLSELTLLPGVRTTAVTGRALNRSEEETIYEMELEVTLSDCVDGACVVIGQNRSATVQRIPPGQLRDVRFTFLFNDLPELRGALEWNAEVTAVRARR